MSEIVNHYGLGPTKLCKHGCPNLDARCPYCERDALRALVPAAEEALAVLTRLADSAAYWSEYDVPVGIVSEIDAAKARLAGALAREARP